MTQEPPSFDDIYPMITRMWWENPWQLAAAITAGLCAIGLIVYWVRRRRKVIVPLTPEQRYFALLAPFKDATFESAEEQRAFYSAVGIALREYLLAMHNWDLMHATDDELSREIQRLAADSAVGDFATIGALVESLTSEAQDVKFAGMRRDAARVREDYEKSITIPTLIALPDRTN